MKKRINLCMCLLAIATCIVTFVATLTISYQAALARMETETMRQAALVAAGLEHIDALDSDEQKAYMQAIGKSDRSRVTLIEPDGTVIYDSNYDHSQMENHLERQEVQEATNNGTGEASRTSATLGQQTYYVAKLLDNGQILRVSNTTDLVTDDLQRAIAPLLLIIIVVIAFSIWLATYLTNRLVRPINTLKLEGDGIEGMGFAIPINSTEDITSQLIQYSKVRRPYIGITGMDLDEETAKANNLVVGVYVKAIDDFSAAEKAGLRIGDVIIEADGQEITTMDELNEIKNSHQIGDEMTVKVNRDGEERDLTITLGEQP